MEKKKFHYGWIIVIACLLVAIANIGFHNTVSIYVRPVTEDLGFTRGEFTFFRTVTGLTSAFLMPFFGRLITKVSIKKMMFFGTFINGLSLAAFGLSQNIWHFYLIAFGAGLFINASNFLIIGILINRWFEDKKGIALGIAFAGSGIGAAIMNPLSTLVIEAYGWRNAFFFAGAFSLMILIPTILLLIKDSPEVVGLEPYRIIKSDTTEKIDAKIRTEISTNGMALADAKKTPQFWLLTIAIFAIALIAATPNAHTVPYLIDIGYSPTLASAVITVCMIFLTSGKILMGGAFDRFGVKIGGLMLGIFSILVPIFALTAHLPISPWLLGTFMGLSASGFSLIGNIYVGKFFGQKDFALILSRLAMIGTLGAAFGPPVMGLAFDLLGNYILAWFVLLAVAIIFTLSLLIAVKLDVNLKKEIST